MHIARLVAITEVKNVPQDIRPFVEFRAAVDDRKLDENERVAILNIDTTSCYIPVFLKDPPSIKDLEKYLDTQDAKLTPDSREALRMHIERKG